MIRAFFSLALLSTVFAGCHFGGGPTKVYYPPQKEKVVIYEEVSHHHDGVVVYEETYTPEPYYIDFCEVSYDGWEECCYDYDWNIVWLSPHEYVWEVCEYSSCVDYWYDDAWMSDVVCWYE